MKNGRPDTSLESLKVKVNSVFYFGSKLSQASRKARVHECIYTYCKYSAVEVI